MINADFTAVALPAASFDLAVCATTLHWLDASVAVPKIAQALRPGGWLAAWWTVFGDTSRPTPFRERLVPMLDERLPGPPESHLTPRALQTAARVRELTADGWFADVKTEQIRWSIDFTPAEVAGLFSTFPNISGHPDRDAILTDITALAAEHARDGAVTENCRCLTLTRTTSSPSTWHAADLPAPPADETSSPHADHFISPRSAAARPFISWVMDLAHEPGCALLQLTRDKARTASTRP